MADFGVDADLEAFRREAKAWLEENAPKSVRRQPDLTMEQMEGGVRPTSDQDLWRKRIGEKGKSTSGRAILAHAWRRR